MLKVYMCFAHEHDYRLLGLATLVCLFASATAMSLIVKVTDEDGRVRRYWLLTAAIATGFGIWSTHFIAMLAFQPGPSTGYSLLGTLISLFCAVTLTGIGFFIAFNAKIRFAPTLGGAVVGLAVAVMHYVGMSAFWVAGRVVWDPTYVILSIALGIFLGAASLGIVFRRSNHSQTIGTILLACTISGLHFLGMAAVTFIPDSSISVPSSALPNHTVAIVIAFTCIGNLYLSIVALLMESTRRRKRTENRRMRELADAAVEGLIVCDAGTIVTVNSSFEKLSDLTGQQVIGRYIAEIFDQSAGDLSRHNNEACIETGLVNSLGHMIPVELIMRPVHYDGKPHQCFAIRDLRDRKRAEAQIHFLAHHDPLTGLANRASFQTRLAQEMTRHRRDDDTFAVICLDLDRFKEVNDVFGHGAGDKVLRTVAGRIARIIDERDLFARLGGDEFSIIRFGPHEPADLAILCDEIISVVQQEVDIDLSGQTASVGSSIGVALFPTDGSDSENLVSNADAALYRAKSEGRGTYRFFEAKIGAHLRARRGLEHDFRQAVSRKELSLVYQPQAAVGTQEVFGFEVLLRWVHPERGEVPPNVFISVAEETGLILPLGEWILYEACAAAAGWQNDLTISVNISSVQLYACDLPAIVRRTLVKTGLPAERLELEIAEAALQRDPRRALQVFNSLKSLGIRISMDDFGTGFSSLSNLRNFPFDKIKIDKSFIQDVHLKSDSATIVRAILGLANGLGLRVVAEGVERREALEFLADVECAEAQGYLFAEPNTLTTFFDEQGVLRRNFYGTQIMPLRLHVA